MTSFLHIISITTTLFTKAVVIVYMLSEGRSELMNWKNSQKCLEAHQSRIFKQLTLAIVTFRVSRRMLKRSVVSFLIFTIVVIKVLAIQIKLVKLVRSLRPFYGPLRLFACIVLAGAFLYLKLLVEVSWAIYYLVMLSRRPSVKDTCGLLFGLLRLLEWK